MTTIAAAVRPVPMDARHYRLGPHGLFLSQENSKANPGELAVFTATAPVHAGGWTAKYTAETARAAAGQLIGYILRHTGRDTEVALGGDVSIDPSVPDIRALGLSRWDLGSGRCTLRFLPPDRAILDVPAPATPRRLTLPLADQWARCLLGLARELDHARAIAAAAVHADRAGYSATDEVRAALDRHAAEQKGDTAELAWQLRSVLADIDRRQRSHHTACALAPAQDNPGQPVMSALLDRDTLTHTAVAGLIMELAEQHGIPLAMITADSHVVLDQVDA